MVRASLLRDKVCPTSPVPVDAVVELPPIISLVVETGLGAADVAVPNEADCSDWVIRVVGELVMRNP